MIMYRPALEEYLDEILVLGMLGFIACQVGLVEMQWAGGG
jgi:hypothetical protein